MKQKIPATTTEMRRAIQDEIMLLCSSYNYGNGQQLD